MQILWERDHWFVFILRCQWLVTDESMRRVSIEIIEEEESRKAWCPACLGKRQHRTRSKGCWVKAKSLENTASPWFAWAWPWDGEVTTSLPLTLDQLGIQRVLSLPILFNLFAFTYFSSGTCLGLSFYPRIWYFLLCPWDCQWIHHFIFYAWMIHAK